MATNPLTIIDQDLLTNPNSVTFDKDNVSEVYQQIYNGLKNNAATNKSQTPNPAKSILEIPTLIKTIIDNAQESVATENKVTWSSEFPDEISQLERITFGVTKREPGTFDRGAPFEGRVKNLRPILREEKDDPNHPGYKIAILGYCFDNIFQLTCCARTSWQAEMRAYWLEELLQQYDWWFVLNGVPRFIYMGRDKEKIEMVDGNKIYCKKLNYFVRTEKLISISTKTLENLTVKLAVQGG